MIKVAESDKYETPPELFNWINATYNFDLDACAETKTAKCEVYFSPLFDAMEADWHQFGKRIFCNPPYSDVTPWVEKAHIASKMGATTVFLVRHDPSVRWYQQAEKWQGRYLLRFPLPFRVHFLLNGAPQGSYNFPVTLLTFLPHLWRPKKGA